LKGRFGYTKGIDTPSQDLQGPSGDVGIDGDIGGVLGLEDDLGSSTQVQAELHR
jgi:hypothetical protein